MSYCKYKVPMSWRMFFSSWVFDSEQKANDVMSSFKNSRTSIYQVFELNYKNLNQLNNLYVKTN